MNTYRESELHDALDRADRQWERVEHRLLADLRTARDDLEAMTAENAAIRRENARLQEDIEELKSEIVAYTEDRELNRQELRHVYASIRAILAGQEEQ